MPMAIFNSYEVTGPTYVPSQNKGGGTDAQFVSMFRNAPELLAKDVSRSTHITGTHRWLAPQS
jgi:hypothetical protein